MTPFVPLPALWDVMYLNPLEIKQIVFTECNKNTLLLIQNHQPFHKPGLMLVIVATVNFDISQIA